MHIDQQNLESNNDQALWQIISELAASDISIDDIQPHYKRLKELTEDPLLSLHPKIGYIMDRLALAAPLPDAAEQAPVAARQAKINVHDERLTGRRKDAQDFLDTKHPLETVTQDAFESTISEIKDYIAINNTYPKTKLSVGEIEIIEIPQSIKQILPEYLDFLVDNNASKQQDNLTNPGVKVICQIWALCKEDNPVIEHKAFFDMLHEAATVYEGKPLRFWHDPERDYTCHPGLEGRLQTLTAHISASLQSDEQKSYAQLLSEYVMQSFSLLSNSETGESSHIAINERTMHMVHGIALKLITPEMFEEKQYSRPMYQQEFNSYYQLEVGEVEGGVFKLKDGHQETNYPRSISAEGVSDTPISKNMWFARNSKQLPEVQGSDFEYAEGCLESLSEQVLKQLYEAWGIDSWLLDLVFTDAQQPDGKEGLRDHIEAYLRDERESLKSGEPLETSEEFIPFNISEEKDFLKQAFKKIAKKFTQQDDATLFTPLSRQEQTWLQEELITRFLPDRNGDNSQLLLNAVMNRNLAHCRAILAITDLPEDVLTKRNRHRQNTLILAIFLGHTGIAKAILDRPNLPDTVLTAQDNLGANALMLAIMANKTEVAEAILNRPNLPDTVLTAQYNNKMNALIIAIKEGFTGIATAILDRPNLPDTVLTAQDYSQESALMIAIDRGHTEIATAILNRPNLPNTVLTAKDEVMNNALMLAITQGHTGIATAILNIPNLPDTVLTAQDYSQESALMIAIDRGHTEIATAILNRPNLPNTVLTAKNLSDGNALMLAIMEGHTGIATAILARDDLPTEALIAKDEQGMNALMLAIDKDHTDIVKDILAKKDLPDSVLKEALGRIDKTAILAILKIAIDQNNFNAAKQIVEEQAIRMSAHDYSTLPTDLQDTFRQHCSMGTRIQISITSAFTAVNNAFTSTDQETFSEPKSDSEFPTTPEKPKPPKAMPPPSSGGPTSSSTGPHNRRNPS